MVIRHILQNIDRQDQIKAIGLAKFIEIRCLEINPVFLPLYKVAVALTHFDFIAIKGTNIPRRKATAHEMFVLPHARSRIQNMEVTTTLCNRYTPKLLAYMPETDDQCLQGGIEQGTKSGSIVQEITQRLPEFPLFHDAA